LQTKTNTKSKLQEKRIKAKRHEEYKTDYYASALNNFNKYQFMILRLVFFLLTSPLVRNPFQNE